jgi:DNA-binding transcriptional LysR family regulator
MSDSLTFRLLRYIKASAETLNFTRAAEQVFVAQSSLSHQIGKLEDNIDVAIFDRLKNGLKITPAGRIVAAYAENTLREWDQMLVMVRAVQRNEIPPLRLGFSSFINAKLLEKFREGYEGMFSGCVIQLSRSRSRNDGFLRRTDADGDIQNLRRLRGRSHLFRRTDLRRDSDDERSFSRRNSGLFGALFGAGVLGWGAGWIGSLTGQSM